MNPSAVITIVSSLFDYFKHIFLDKNTIIIMLCNYNLKQSQYLNILIEIHHQYFKILSLLKFLTKLILFIFC